jgi:hypothetical protein
MKWSFTLLRCDPQRAQGADRSLAQSKGSRWNCSKRRSKPRIRQSPTSPTSSTAGGNDPSLEPEERQRVADRAALTQPDSYFSACCSKSAARTEPLAARRSRTVFANRARVVIQAAVVRGSAQGGGSAA